MEGTCNKKNVFITSSVNILLHSVIKLRLCYCFENATSSGENLHIVPLNEYLLVSIWTGLKSLLNAAESDLITQQKAWYNRTAASDFAHSKSPDLNPIENFKRKMDGHKPSNKAELLE